MWATASVAGALDRAAHTHLPWHLGGVCRHVGGSHAGIARETDEDQLILIRSNRATSAEGCGHRTVAATSSIVFTDFDIPKDTMLLARFS